MVIGSVLALAISQPPADEVPVPTTSRVIPQPEAVAPTRPTPTPVTQPTLAELIPGLDRDLVAFGTDAGGFPAVQRWDLNSSAPISTGIRLQSGSVDLSGLYLAALVDQRYGDGFNLVVGTPNFVETIATDAGSFAWSTTTPREIAWTERTESGFVVRSRQVLLNSGETPEFEIPVPEDVFIAWLRNDTIAIQDNQGLLRVIDRDGEELHSLDFNELSDGFSGFTAATDTFGIGMIQDVPHVMSPSLEVMAEIPTNATPCFPAGFAPSRDPVARRLAMLCFGANDPHILVFDIGIGSDGIPTVSAPATFPIEQPSLPIWLGNERFLGVTQHAAAGRPRTDQVIFDLVTGETHTLAWPGSIGQVIAYGQP